MTSLDRKIKRAKCCILGNAAVGKSTWIRMIASDHSEFSKTYQMTLNVDLVVKALQLPEKPETMFEFTIYDLAGHEAFRENILFFTKDISFIILVVDVTEQKSFDDLKSWLELCKSIRNDKLPILLIATKTDLVKRRKVTEKILQQFSQEHKMKLFEISSLLKQNLLEPFRFMAQYLI